MKNSSVPKLKDVAESANVSVAAASRILSGNTDRFGKETVQRVLDVAQKLGWRKNLLVSGIQTGRTKTVGVMIPPYDSFWINVLSGIHNRLTRDDYLPITVWIGDLGQVPYFEERAEGGLRQINRLLERRVDALIMWPQIAVNYRDYIFDISEQNVPVVVIDHQASPPFGDSVVTNESKSTRIIAKHLLDLGHRRIACIGERCDTSHDWSRQRVRHFHAALAATDGVKTCFGQLNDTGSDGLEVALRLLSHEHKPTAVFAVTDHLAKCVYKAASQLNLNIPNDVSVVGFSDLDFASEMSPPLTTLHQNPEKMGVKAAELALSRLNSDSDSLDFTLFEIDGDFILRESTGPVSDHKKSPEFH